MASGSGLIIAPAPWEARLEGGSLVEKMSGIEHGRWANVVGPSAWANRTLSNQSVFSFGQAAASSNENPSPIKWIEFGRSALKTNGKKVGFSYHPKRKK